MNAPHSQLGSPSAQGNPSSSPHPAPDPATDHRRMFNPALHSGSHLSADRPVDSEKKPKRRHDVDETECSYQCSSPGCTKSYSESRLLRAHVFSKHTPDNGFSGPKALGQQRRKGKKEGTSNGKGPSSGGKPSRAPQITYGWSLEQKIAESSREDV